MNTFIKMAVNQPAQTIIKINDNSQERDTTRSNLSWPPAPHWDTILCVALSTSKPSAASDELYFFGIVATVNRPAQTIFSPTNDSTTDREIDKEMRYLGET